MHNYIVIRHKVKDFSSWKPVYDSDLSRRKQYGIKEKYLSHSDSDPNEMIVMFETDDVDRAREYIESDKLHDLMEKAGVIDKPDIMFMHE